MAIIKSGSSAAQLTVDPTSTAARVTLYDAAGNPVTSQIRGTGVNYRTDGASDLRDLVGIALPGTAGAVAGGTTANPFQVAVTNQTLAVQVANASPLPVAFATRQPVSCDFPTVQAVAFPSAQQVTFPSAQQVTFPSAQPITGSVNAGLRVGGVDVSGSNPVPVAATLQVAGASVAAGNALPVTVVDPAPYDGFVATIDVVPATTLVSGTVYFALRNGGSRSLYVRRFDLQMGFTGTAAASRSSYEIVRFTAGTPSGGTAMAPAKKITSSAASAATVLVAPAGLTMTGAAYDAGPIHRVASPNQLSVSTTQDVIFTDELVLAPGEGVVVRANGAVVAGSFLTGSLGWYER